MTRVFLDHLYVPPAMPIPPPTLFLPVLLSSLETTDPRSQMFPQMLELLLLSKRERELLEQLEGSTAISAADTLDKVRDRRLSLANFRLTSA